jgi:hypothetical protein
MAGMMFERVGVSDLAADKVGSKHLSRVCPRRIVGGEDAMAEEGNKRILSAITQAPVLEIQRLDGFQDLWFDCHVYGSTGEHGTESITNGLESGQAICQHGMVLDRYVIPDDEVQSKKRIP